MWISTTIIEITDRLSWPYAPGKTGPQLHWYQARSQLPLQQSLSLCSGTYCGRKKIRLCDGANRYSFTRHQNSASRLSAAKRNLACIHVFSVRKMI
jgi:hypothetical protein